MTDESSNQAPPRKGSSKQRPAGEGEGEASPIIIKKYANRRLYNTHTSSYVTLEHLAQMVKDGVEFTVHDAKSGDDITRAVLTQIIVEEEAKGQNLLPIGFLRQLISLYGDSLQGLVPQYLDVMMGSFADNQDQIRNYLDGALGGFNPFQQMEEISRRNMQVFEQAVNMFSSPDTPHAQTPADRTPAGQTPADEIPADQTPAEDTPPPADAAAEDPTTEERAAFDELKSQLLTMQRQLDALSRKNEE
jgi:polyhydroxyalkanoate synthesis repressor PhaR